MARNEARWTAGAHHVGLTVPELGAAVRFFEAMFDALMRLIHWIIWVTPVGVFLLVAWTVGNIGLGNLIGPISKYIAVVLTGLPATLPLDAAGELAVTFTVPPALGNSVFYCQAFEKDLSDALAVWFR